jgi:hypothetical protein
VPVTCWTNADAKCQRRYTIEPGFYYGAMYVSYAMTVAVAVSIWVAILVLNPEMDLDWQVGLIGAVMVLGAPLFYAPPEPAPVSKITWANMFLEYKGPSSGTEEQRQPEG